MKTPEGAACRRANTSLLLFPSTVALGYLSGYFSGDLAHRRWPGVLCIALGLLYSALGCLVDHGRFKFRESPWRCGQYLLLESLLLAGILVLSRMTGEMWICVFPLEVLIVVLLPPAAALLAVLALYGATISAAYAFYGAGNLLPNSLSFLPAFGFVALFSQVAVREREARRRAERLADEVEALAVIRERNRLAREIHDSLGHFLTTISVQLEAARAVHAADPAQALAAVGKAEGLAREALSEVRRSVAALYADRPPSPLPARLAELVAAAEGSGPAVALEVLGEVRPLSAEIEHALFRAAQEGLTNVLKHAQARTAGITLDYRDSRRVHLRVRDDGRGPCGAPEGHGLTGLAERVRDIGGRLDAQSPENGGFVLSVQIPA